MALQWHLALSCPFIVSMEHVLICHYMEVHYIVLLDD